MQSHTLFYLGVILLAFSAKLSICSEIANIEELLEKEIGYKLQGNLHSKQTGYDGDSLVVGSAPEFVLDGDGTIELKYHCLELSGMQGYENSGYGTRVMKRSTRSYQVTAEETRSPVTYSEYFVYITRKVIKCTDSQKKLPDFLKIVNQIVSVKEIFEIKYYDGVEVSSVNHLGDERRVKIIETKYLLQNSSGLYTITYEGESIDSVQHDNHHFIPDLITEHILYKEKKTENEGLESEKVSGEFKEWLEDKDTHFVQISNTGKSLKIGYNWMKVRKSYKGLFKCQRVQGMNPFPHVFRPECYQQVQVENSNKMLYAEIADRDFLKFFTFVKREVWLCTGTNKVESFLRIVTEVIGRTQVKTLEYEGGITSLYSIRVPDGVGIRFKEIRYFDANTRELSTGNVDLELVEPEELHSVSMELKSMEIKYALSVSTVYRTLISTEGYDLRVGSSLQVRKGDPRYTVICQFSPNYRFNDEFETVFKIKMNEDNVMYRMQEISKEKKPKYYRYISREAWYCDHFEQYRFIRIVNKIEVLVPVREIETVDGVEIFHTLLDNNKKSVNIVETKYIEHPSLKHVLFVGKVQTIQDTFRASKYAISKTLDETVPKIGHTPERSLDSRDVDPNWEPQKYKKLAIGEGNYVINLNFVPIVTTSNEKDIADCEWSKAHPDNLNSKFQIFDKKTNKLKAIEKEQNVNSIYFEKIVREVWICRKTEEDNTFLRVLIEQSLKRSALKEIGEIQFTEMDKVWIEMENDGYVVKMNEIRYLQKSDHRPVNYLGHLVFEENPRSGLWHSGTTKFLNDNDNLTRELNYHGSEEDTIYNLDRERKYTFTFSDVGDILEIGSKWQRFFGDKDSIIYCEIHQKKDGVVDEKYRSKVFILNKNEEKKYTNVFEEYFENLKQEIWKCVDKNGNNILRVLNQLSIKNKENNEKFDIKCLLYYDGVTVLLGDHQSSKIQIIEVKYLDLRDSALLKFEGKVELKGTDAGKIGVVEALMSAKDVLAKLDAHYLLGENEVYKTVVNSRGMILEVGEKFDSYSHLSTHHTMRCTKNTQVEKKMLEELKPRVVLSLYLEAYGDFISDTLHNSEMINNYFEFTHENWHCTDDTGIKYIRVVNKLKLKDHFPVAQIYHHDNVVLNLDDGVYIEELKFLLDKTYRKAIYKGIALLVDEKIDANHLHKLGKPFREIEYFLDTDTVYLANPSSIGRTIEVGTHWQEELKNNNHQVVTCKRRKSRVYDDAFGMTVFTDSFMATENSNKNCCPYPDKFNSWIAMTDKKNPGYFEAVDQDIRQCMINKEIVFYRVMNKVFIKKEMARIFYPDGVTVRALVFPDKSTCIQITEVKYVEPNTNIVLKYDGELKMEANDVVDRLIQIPPKIAGKNLVPLTYNPSKEVYRPSTINHLTLDALRVYSLRKISESSEGIIHGIAYSQKLLTTVFTDSGYRRFKIGSHWDELFTTTGATMKCLLDEWNTFNRLSRFRYIPRVMEYVDGNLYEVDEDGLDDIFQVVKIELWICTNEMDTILRVVSVLRGKIPIYAIRHYDGVHVDIFELEPGINSVEITETVYVDPKSSKFLKYEGDLQQTITVAGLKLETESSLARVTSEVYKSFKKKFWNRPWFRRS